MYVYCKNGVWNLHGKCWWEAVSLETIYRTLQRPHLLVNATDHKWVRQTLVNEKSILSKVMNLCSLTRSFYLSQCWPRSRAMTEIQQSMTWSAWYRIGDKPLSKQFATEIANASMRHRIKEVKIKWFPCDIRVFTWFSTLFYHLQ